MKRHVSRTMVGTAVAAFLLAACYDSLVENPSFDLWCEDKLCSWDIDEGRIERVPTWHSKDYGVSFRDTPTQISQLSSDTDVTCLHFDVIADTEADARMSVAVDFDDDGEIDWQKVLPDSDWETQEFWVRPPSEYENMRFIVRKSGKGRAVLAQFHIADDGTCGSFADDVE